jgi:predicted house-cleaning noncanonical NTP pyrophosphatase (MazG superfamily)
VRLLAAHIHRLVTANAIHVKSGNSLWSLTDDQIFNHLHAEVCELHAEPDNIDEFGDILCILFHLAHRRGWSIARMEEAALRKLAMRFQE